MKVGTDGTLLGAWAYASQGTKQHILDVGTGTGLIAIMMAQRLPEAKVIGIEIDPVAASQAQQNVTSSPFSSRVSISCQSFQEHAKQAGLAVYDAIVCNPPFFSQSLTCPESRRTQAHCEPHLHHIAPTIQGNAAPAWDAVGHHPDNRKGENGTGSGRGWNVLHEVLFCPYLRTEISQTPATVFQQGTL